MWRRLRATCKRPTGGGWQAVGLGAVVCGLVLHITFVPFSSTLQSLQNLKLAANLNLIGLAAEDNYLAACQRMNQGAVVFQNASWKAEVGCWLNQCHAHTSSFPVPEVLGGKSCDQGCKEHGVCNEELGHCRCFLGFSGLCTIFFLHNLKISPTFDIMALPFTGVQGLSPQSDAS